MDQSIALAAHSNCASRFIKFYLPASNAQVIYFPEPAFLCVSNCGRLFVGTLPGLVEQPACDRGLNWLCTVVIIVPICSVRNTDAEGVRWLGSLATGCQRFAVVATGTHSVHTGGMCVLSLEN